MNISVIWQTVKLKFQKSRLNRLRTSLSAVKGGRLGRTTRATLVNLVLSDVPRDDPALVGSGPTIRNRGSDVVHVVASNRDWHRARPKTEQDFPEGRVADQQRAKRSYNIVLVSLLWRSAVRS